MEKLYKLFENESSKFNVETYVKNKLKSINVYFKVNNLDSCVIGLSGGIDSSVVYYLMLEASKQENSPIKIVKPLILPIYCNGTTGQSVALEMALKLKNTSLMNVYDLTDAFNGYINVNINKTKSWCNGQLASIVRTPFLYYKAAELQENGYKSVVIGTTNKSEKLLGFYGKASDYMVDIQPIYDIYKSEVFKVAEYLKVPQQIIERKPVGDVYNNNTDEEMIGAPYWFVEMFFKYPENTLYNNDKDNHYVILEYITNIKKMLKHNNHKFNVGSPSVFL